MNGPEIGERIALAFFHLLFSGGAMWLAYVLVIAAGRQLPSATAVASTAPSFGRAAMVFFPGAFLAALLFGDRADSFFAPAEVGSWVLGSLALLVSGLFYLLKLLGVSATGRRA